MATASRSTIGSRPRCWTGWREAGAPPRGHSSRPPRAHLGAARSGPHARRARDAGGNALRAMALARPGGRGREGRNARGEPDAERPALPDLSMAAIHRPIAPGRLGPPLEPLLV